MFDLEHVRYLVVDRGLVKLWDESLVDSVHVTPTVFFDRDRDNDDAPPSIPHELLEERKRRLDAGLGTREQGSRV